MLKRTRLVIFLKNYVGYQITHEIAPKCPNRTNIVALKV